MRRRLFAGNWKMNKTAAETRAFVEAFALFAPTFAMGADVAIAPPFTSLAAARQSLMESTRIALAAQNMHWEDRGAFTGEISPLMLQELGVRYVILGHSERRTYFGETDANVNAKVKAALAHGITPIVAVGETLDERNAGQADQRVAAQTRATLGDLDATDLARIVLAYEPIWAIGTGQNCDAQEADRVMGVIRSSVIGIRDVPVLYGGSMNAANVAAYVRLPNIDGGLIGGASLDPTTFATLIANGTQPDSTHA